jgi:N-acetylmuramic acid 6-phosphate etherase
VLIGLAASGRTPFTLAALGAARAAGALTVGMSNNAGAPILSASDHPILVETGPEVLAGSTRMKAGTAQKAVLNMISTGIMVRLGRVHAGLMVDMRPANAKLRVRAAEMVARIAGGTAEAAQAALPPHRLEHQGGGAGGPRGLARGGGPAHPRGGRASAAGAGRPLRGRPRACRSRPWVTPRRRC